VEAELKQAAQQYTGDDGSFPPDDDIQPGLPFVFDRIGRE
jgi:hypothetical protein